MIGILGAVMLCYAADYSSKLWNAAPGYMSIANITETKYGVDSANMCIIWCQKSELCDQVNYFSATTECQCMSGTEGYLLIEEQLNRTTYIRSNSSIELGEYSKARKYPIIIIQWRNESS